MGTALEDVAAECDAACKAARERLIEAVREASRAGMTQREIAERIGRRSQPEVARLLRFHGTGPLARVLRRHRSDVLRIVADAGGSNVRVFGSVATGTERPGSDIDLLFTMGRVMTLLELAELEITLEDLLGVEVDLVPESDIRPGIRDRILTESVLL